MAGTVKPNYYNQHLIKMFSRVIIPKGDLQKGMVISNLYKNLKGETKTYMFLVLNPFFKNKVHVLSLNEFTVARFNELTRTTGIRMIHKYKKRGLVIPKLTMRESSNRFYYGQLAMNMEKLYNNSYRTLLFNSMGMVTLIDYQFDDDIMERGGFKPHL